MPAARTAAIVVYQGVLVDEVEILRFVLSRLPDFRLVTAGTSPGLVTGVGGVLTVQAALSEVRRPQVVAVPGGIGSHRRDEIGAWLARASPKWMLASSTGSALLAAAGLLRDTTAAGHWLAGSIMEQYGARASREPVVVNGPIITCSGVPSAFRAALVIAEFYGGAELAERIRAEAANPENHRPPCRQGPWARLRAALRRRGDDPTRPAAGEPLGRVLREVDELDDLAEIEVLDLGLMSPPADVGHPSPDPPSLT